MAMLPSTTRGFRTVLVVAVLAMSACPAVADDAAPAEQISAFRLRNGEGRVTRDATLDRIAMEQARAMADKDDLSHDVLGPFNRRVSPSNAGHAAENIAYGYDNFDKTLGQWINSSGHRKNLLLHNATKVGIASAKTASGKRTIKVYLDPSRGSLRPPLEGKPTALVYRNGDFEIMDGTEALAAGAAGPVLPWQRD